MDHRSPIEQILERIERTLATVVVGLEILTGVCAGLEDVETSSVGAETLPDGEIATIGSVNADLGP